jgi:hypothetical protein
MESVIVKPVKQRGEELFVLTATVAILLCAGISIAIKKQGEFEKALKWYQISAFSQLSTNEQGVFTDLYTSAFDIDIYHRNNSEEWPDIPTLEANVIPPFVRDAVWEKRGRITWALRAMDKETVHRSLYIGKSTDPGASGSFILFLEHFHTMDGAYFYGINKKQPFTIWHKSGDFSLPDDISEGTLISSGWKEAIPYKGKDILQSLNRVQ